MSPTYDVHCNDIHVRMPLILYYNHSLLINIFILTFCMLSLLLLICITLDVTDFYTAV